MKMIYGVKDRPPAGKLILFALQQLLAILAATIAVPRIVGNDMSPGAALFGAGVGTMVYLLFTKFKSPVFLGSSFAFLGSMAAAFAGGVSMSLGYLGLLIGAAFAGLVYVVIAVIVKFAGVKWIDKIMPAVVIGPTVAIIGLSLAGNAVGDLLSGSATYTVIEQVSEFIKDAEGAIIGAQVVDVEVTYTYANTFIALLCGLVTLAVTMVCSVYGKKTLKMIPFIIGILAGYAVAAIFTGFSYIPGAESLRVIDFSIFKKITEPESWYPLFSFLKAFNIDKSGYGVVENGVFRAFTGKEWGAYIGGIAVAYIPVAFVVFAEHLADHKNISSIIEHDLLKDPGLHRTLLGDGVGSVAGAFFGGCPNTTYGESVGCVAISQNASVATIFITACMAILSAFLAPFTLFLSSIPSCVMGGVCIALYGFIAVSGLKMIQKEDLNDHRNLFTVCVVLIAGVGGLVLTKGKVTLTAVACALILGILTNLLLNIKTKKGEAQPAVAEGESEASVAMDEAEVTEEPEAAATAPETETSEEVAE